MEKLVVLILLAVVCSGCTVQFGIDYTGQTAKDDRTFTPHKPEPVEREGRKY